MRALLVFLSIAAVALVAVACGDDEDGSTSETAPAISVPAPREAFAEPLVRPWLAGEATAAGRAEALAVRSAERLDDDGVPVPSDWRGEVTGEAAGDRFRLPLFVSLYPRQTPLERGRLRMYLGNRADRAFELGGFVMASAYEILAPDGSPVTITYMDVSVRDGRIEGRLTDDGHTIGAALNQFVAANLTARYAPDVWKPIAESLGPYETFLFEPGTRVRLELDGDRLTGTVDGRGRSLTGLFPLPDVRYTATLVATRMP